MKRKAPNPEPQTVTYEIGQEGLTLSPMKQIPLKKGEDYPMFEEMLVIEPYPSPMSISRKS